MRVPRRSDKFPMQYEFEVSDLEMRYPHGDLVLKDLSINFERGGFHILLGQNGSGKSSLMKCLAGIQSWSKGEILHRGFSRKFDRRDFNGGIISISEDVVLPNMKIETLAAIYKEVWGEFDQEVFARLLSYSKISQSKLPLQLSRGQKALAQVALALATGIDTLIIDEITAVLDPYVRGQLVSELINFNREKGTTIIVATNIATEFRGLDAHVVLLEHGSILLSGVMSEVSKEFVLVEERPDIDLGKFVHLPGVTATRILIGRRHDVLERAHLLSLPITIEDIFIYLTGRGAK